MSGPDMTPASRPTEASGHRVVISARDVIAKTSQLASLAGKTFLHAPQADEPIAARRSAPGARRRKGKAAR